MAKVIIDAGHGGSDGGAVYNGRLEKEDNLQIALAVGEILEQNGVEVVYTRETDVYDSPTEKARIANASGADYFVSIHRNASPSPNQYSGVETLVYDNSGIKVEMAEAINEELEQVGFRNLGVKERPNLAVLRRTQMPAVLVEVGFLNTDADNALLDAQFDNVAQAIANGITRTIFGGEYVGGTTGDGSGGVGSGSPEGGYRYRVQTGLFRSYQNAERLAEGLRLLGFPVEIVQNGAYYAVMVGNEDSLAEGSALERELQALGYDTLLVAY